LWSFAIVLLIAGVGILPLAQPEQARRWQAEHLLQTGLIPEAMRFMAETPREDFPPLWDPPPRTGYHEEFPEMDKVAAALQTMDAPQWLQEAYAEKALATHSGLITAVYEAQQGKPEQLKTFMTFLEQLPPPDKSKDMHWQLMEAAQNPRIDEALRERVRTYLGLSEEQPKELPSANSASETPPTKEL
jgi:hypothetical protein